MEGGGGKNSPMKSPTFSSNDRNQSFLDNLEHVQKFTQKCYRYIVHFFYIYIFFLGGGENNPMRYRKINIFKIFKLNFLLKYTKTHKIALDFCLFIGKMTWNVHQHISYCFIQRDHLKKINAKSD